MPTWRGCANSSPITWPSWPPRFMTANLLPTYQASVADFGGCVILYPPPVGCGKAEIRCCGRGTTPPGLYGSLLGKRYAGASERHALSSVSPQKSVNSKQLASKLSAISYTNPYPRFSVTRQLSLG